MLQQISFAALVPSVSLFGHLCCPLPFIHSEAVTCQKTEEKSSLSVLKCFWHISDTLQVVLIFIISSFIFQLLKLDCCSLFEANSSKWTAFKEPFPASFSCLVFKIYHKERTIGSTQVVVSCCVNKIVKPDWRHSKVGWLLG